MATKQKYYVVWKGVKPGIYTSWEECQQQIKGFDKALYKSYENLEQATLAFRKGYEPPVKKKITGNEKINYYSICVDAACSGNPGDMEYRGVETKNANEIFRIGPMAEGTNNIGEFLAIVHALALLQKKGLKDMAIYTDSKTAMAWVRDKKVKTNLTKTHRNQQIFDLIERALGWLHQNHWQNPILKWETEKWGEIPADFGRK